ncbi:MAG: thermonuclease family protein [Gammaproteobacteria bacterium]
MQLLRRGQRQRGLWITLVLSTVWMLTASVSACQPVNGRATKVFDGDSFLMRDAEGKEVEIRLFAIDAPERSQPWSRRSRESLRRMIRDQDLSVERVDTDRYGRVVAKVTRLSDGLVINTEMIRRGDAWVYRRYAGDPEVLTRLGLQQLFELEQAARNQSVGLWSLPEAARTPPWEWRRQQRAQTN